MDPGLAPDGFTFWRTGDGDVGDWRVLEDPSASDRQVIAQMSKDPTDYRFQLAVYRPISAKNVDVVLRLKPVGGTRLVESSCGSPRQTTITRSAPVLSKTMSGSIAWSRGSGNSLTARTSKSPPTNGTRSARAENDRFTISFDGSELFSTMDSTFVGTGKVGLWSKADSVTYFDGIAITPLE